MESDNQDKNIVLMIMSVEYIVIFVKKRWTILLYQQCSNDLDIIF